jgi:hypothetical protein
LYRKYLDNEIKWSEAAFPLTPKYLHLHEKHISQNNIYKVEGYKMTSFLSSFVNSLGKGRKYLEKIIFCHSFENESGLSPEMCKHEKFYALEIYDPGRYRSIEDTSAAIIYLGEMEDSDKPSPLDLRADTGLGSILREADLIQPYILKNLELQKVLCTHDIRKNKGQRTINGLLRSFRREVVINFPSMVINLRLDIKKNVWSQKSSIYFWNTLLFYMSSNGITGYASHMIR